MDTNKNIKGYQIIKRIGKGGCGAAYLAQKENAYIVLVNFYNHFKLILF